MITASLPIVFDTPMFWSSEDLEQLRGTAILGRSPSQTVVRLDGADAIL